MKVVVTADTREFRRAVGVTAWCVLEELLLDASRDDRGRVVVSTNVRRLAAALGVSKDTAARAVARLVRAGVVERAMSERGTNGTFPTALYVLDVATVSGLTGEISPPNAVPHPAPRARLRPARRVERDQASLFELPASIS